ncbi:hypothetical protein CIP107506_02081 [Corynebacterium diphtheriae]|nr:hypothetical protein CIP107506_02081 [Corynebacterium diphtheriae]
MPTDCLRQVVLIKPTFLVRGIVGPTHEMLIFEFNESSDAMVLGEIPAVKSSTAFKLYAKWVAF